MKKEDTFMNQRCIQQSKCSRALDKICGIGIGNFDKRSRASILPVEQTSGTCNKHQYKNFVFCKIHVSVIYINIQNKILKQLDPGDDFDK